LNARLLKDDRLLMAELRPWLPIALAAGWGLEVLVFGMAPVYTVLGLYATCVALLLAWDQGAELRRLLTLRLRDVGVGIGGGLLMIALTYPIYALAVTHIPGLPDQVRWLYRVADTTGRPWAVAVLVWIIVVEELLWRGALFKVLSARTSMPLAVAGSVATYVLVQVGAGSWVVPVIALVCGLFWNLQRVWTAGLVAPLLTHLIWDLAVLVWWPLEPR